MKIIIPYEDDHGNILDGHHRIKICAELGITEYPKVIRAGMTDTEKRTHARKLNMARRHMTQEQRRALIKEQLKETPGKSDRQIAAELDVDYKTVSVQRDGLIRRGEIPHVEKTTDTLGRQQPRKPVSVFNPTSREETALQDPAVVDKIASGEAKSVTVPCPGAPNNSGLSGSFKCGLSIPGMSKGILFLRTPTRVFLIQLGYYCYLFF